MWDMIHHLPWGEIAIITATLRGIIELVELAKKLFERKKKKKK